MSLWYIIYIAKKKKKTFLVLTFFNVMSLTPLDFVIIVQQQAKTAKPSNKNTSHGVSCQEIDSRNLQQNDTAYSSNLPELDGSLLLKRPSL